MSRTDFGLGLGFMVLAALVYVLSLDLDRVQIGIGPGDYPRVVAVGLFILGAVLAGQSLFKAPPSAKGLHDKEASLRVAILAAMTLAYILLLRYIGFLFLTPVFLLATLYHFGLRKPVTAVAVSVGVTLAIHLVFYNLFHVLLPKFTLF